MKRLAALLALSIAGLSAVVAGQRGPQTPPSVRAPVVVGRSKVATTYGIVAASQPLAARAGVQVLERGGNAVERGHRDQCRLGRG
jgi:hypothetical protein